MFNKYYEDELAFLREMGAEFARANPAAAHFLAERGADPDVERLLEGFAFLTGRLRQKLDDELPELTQSLMQMLWPHYLRPVPAMSILQFEPVPQLLQEPQTVPRGTEVDSVPVEGTACRFRTCYDVPILPLVIDAGAVEVPPGTRGHLRLSFRLTPGAKAESLVTDRIRLLLHGEPTTAYALYLYLTRFLKQIVIRPAGGRPEGQRTLPPDAVKPLGFAEEDAVLPYPTHAFPGYRLLQEYFALPQKYLFLDVTGLSFLPAMGISDAFEMIFEFSRAPESSLRVGAETVRLHGTPVVNLFPMQSDPMRVDHQKVEYLVRPGGGNPAHYEVFSIEHVKGWMRGTAEEREYPSFMNFRHGVRAPSGPGIIYYNSRLRNSVLGPGVDTYVSFVTGGQERAVPPTETVVSDLVCTNRHLPAKLRVGDISRPTAGTPEFARFRNITPVTPTITPPLGGELHWRLISNMSLNYISLASVEALRAILEVYNFQALQERQAARENELRLSGIVAVKALPEERLYRGAPVRGTRIEIDMKEENFAGEGEMVLFASVLNEFLAIGATINAFVRLVARGVKHGETYEWTPRIGQQPLV